MERYPYPHFCRQAKGIFHLAFFTSRRKSELMAVAAALLWSTGGVLIKLIPWNALVISGARSLLAVGVMLIYIRASGSKIRFNRYSVMSGICMAGLLLSFVVSNKLTTAANAIVLQYTSPAFILIFSALFLKQKFHAADFGVVIATIFGISLFFIDRLTPGHLLGNCVAVFAGVLCAANYIICGQADTDSRLSGILFSHIAAAAVGLSAAFVYPPEMTPVAVWSILALGIFQIGVSYIFYALAFRDCPPLACSLIGAIEPLLNPVWVFLYNGEAPGSFALLGGVIVLVSVTGWCIWRDHFVAAHSKAA